MPFYVTASVESEMRFREYGAAVQASLNKAYAEAALVILREVRARETRVGVPRKNGKLPGVHVPEGVHLRDSFRAGFVLSKYFGFLGAPASAAIIIESANPNAIWQEYGTRGRRKKAYKPNTRGGGRTEGNRGVTPLRFMRNGLAAAFPEVQAIIEAAVASAGDVLGGSTLVDTTSPLTTPKRAGVSPRRPLKLPF